MEVKDLFRCYDIAKEYHSEMGDMPCPYDEDFYQETEEYLSNISLPQDVSDVSDGYHTFNELYEFRKLYNAAFFNELAKNGYNVVKSKRHNDGEECFGGGWFIVMAELPTGQISNHYELKDWDLFRCDEVETSPKWDGHTPKDVIDRITKYLKM